jgi:hypothetical protein
MFSLPLATGRRSFRGIPSTRQVKMQAAEKIQEQ